MSIGHLYVPLGEVLIQVLCPFFNWIVILVWSHMSSLYILEIKPLSDVSLANMFSHAIGSLFILMMMSLSMCPIVISKCQKIGKYHSQLNTSLLFTTQNYSYYYLALFTLKVSAQ